MIRRSFAIFLVLLIFSAGRSAWSQPSATIVFSNASPPVQVAGQQVVIRVGLLNSGTVPWRVGEYAISIDLFQNDTFVTATPVSPGTAPVQVGETLVLYVPLLVPSDFRGEYKYRVRFLFNDQPLVVGEPRFSFQVEERLTETPKFKREIHGDLSGNWLYDEANGGRATSTSNVTFKLSPHTSASFYGFADQGSQTNTNHLDYYGPTTVARFGYHYGDLSELAFYGIGGTGVGVTQQVGKGKIYLNHMLVQQPREGSPFSNGAYARDVWAQKVSYPLGRKVDVGLLNIHSYDLSDSIMNSGPTLTPSTNDVTAVDMSYRFSPFISLQGLYGINLLDDKSRGREPLRDRAWKMQVRANNRDSSLAFSGSFYKTGVDYVSLGAPGLVNDRKGYDFSGSWRASNRLSLSSGFSGYHNNVRGVALSRLLNDNMSLGAVYLLSPATQLMLNHFRTGFQTLGAGPFPTENRTWNTSVTLNHAFKGWNFNTSWFASEFRDYTGISPELSTQSTSFNLSRTFRNQSTLSLGHNANISENLRTGILSVNHFSSMNWSIYVIPDRLIALVGISQNQSKNVPFVDSVNDLVNLSFAYRIWRNHALGFGWTWNSSDDHVNPQNSFKDRTFTTNYNTRF